MGLHCTSNIPSHYHGRASVTLFLTLTLVVGLETVLLSSVSDSHKLFKIYWNTTNSIFRIDNTDHIIDVNTQTAITNRSDQLDIYCPHYVPGVNDKDMEKYVIYSVTKEEYDTCRITNPRPTIVATCTEPYKKVFYTFSFRKYSPTPGGLEFMAGQDYYFISTSAPNDIHRRNGGRCLTDNMKVVFKVCCAKPKNTTQINNNINNNNNNNVWSRSSSGIMNYTSTTPMPAVYSYSTSSSTISPYAIPALKTMPSKELPNESPKTTPKKSNEYDKHPNEVVKNEELTYNNAYASAQVRWSIIILTLIMHLLYNRR